jgi:hypothetical protein
MGRQGIWFQGNDQYGPLFTGIEWKHVISNLVAPSYRSKLHRQWNITNSCSKQ